MNTLTWTIVAQIAAIAVLVRMVGCANRINSRCVPCIVRAAFAAMATSALAVLFSPWVGFALNWPHAVFAVCVAFYVWADRRGPPSTEIKS